MKFSIEFSVMHRYLNLFGRLTRVVRCLGMGFSYPTIGDLWTNVIDHAESERCDASKLFHGSIIGYLNQPKLNRHKRSGEPRRLATLPI